MLRVVSAEKSASQSSVPSVILEMDLDSLGSNLHFTILLMLQYATLKLKINLNKNMVLCLAK